METQIKVSAIGDLGDSAMAKLVGQRDDLIDVPPIGEIISGSIIDKARNALYVDLGLLGVGVIYGRDLFDDQETFKKAKLGDEVKATVERYDNEDDYIELSLRSATKERSWEELKRMMQAGDVFETEVLDANKGGLIIRVRGVTGFLPVSQLAQEHYPRVEGGDKAKILIRLKEYIGDNFKVKVIAADQNDEKLIVSEKAALSDELSSVLEKIDVGTVVKGSVSGVVEFGVFLKFEVDGTELEGLVHISELAWQRIDDPLDFVSLGEEISAKVIGVDGLRISLSVKQMQDDPWKNVKEKYKVGSDVKGEVIKVTPFGGFVKLDDDIHGLIHLSELQDEAQMDPALVLKVGEKKKFRIISLEPSDHRLGLSLRKENKTEKSKAK
ncbi:MAG: S1 RNA-binding domain-containing protein [bacterium]